MTGKHLPPLLKEFFVAAASMSAVGVVVAVAFRLVTGLSPWPYVVLTEVAAFGFGTTMLAIASPRSRSSGS